MDPMERYGLWRQFRNDVEVVSFNEEQLHPVELGCMEGVESVECRHHAQPGFGRCIDDDDGE